MARFPSRVTAENRMTHWIFSPLSSAVILATTDPDGPKVFRNVANFSADSNLIGGRSRRAKLLMALKTLTISYSPFNFLVANVHCSNDSPQNPETIIAQTDYIANKQNRFPEIISKLCNEAATYFSTDCLFPTIQVLCLYLFPRKVLLLCRI